MSHKLKLFLFCLSLFLFVGCDRVTKQLAKDHLMNREPISYFYDTCIFVYAENTGAALSMGDGLSKAAGFWLLSMLPLLFLISALVYSIYHSKEFRWLKMFSLALVIGGGLGNVIDRIMYDRHVTDFMILGIGSLKTGIFNVADVCVTFGIIGLFFFFNESKTTEKSADEQLLQ